MPKKFIWVHLLFAVVAFGQASRYDAPLLTINNSQPTPGNLYPVYSFPGAAVQICTKPASGNPCTNLATTYTDDSHNIACSPTTQFTRPGSNVCVANADNIGGFGAWLSAGNYQYTVQTKYGNSGPYDFSVGPSAGNYANLNSGSMQIFIGPIQASNEGQQNVAAFGAKGDCVTDDHNAILAAMTTAAQYQPYAAVIFPMPLGGCYLTSTLTWNGAPLIGQPGMGFTPAVKTAAVVLKGMPGQDVVHVLDPTTNAVTGPSPSWQIRDITFMVDDSTDVSNTTPFAHRWPGRWFYDATISLSTPTILSTSNGAIGCNDAGQNISITGAGPAGVSLVTTIASVSPCYSQLGSSHRTITLTTGAATAVTNASAYLTPMSIPTTTHIGNCGLAFDDSDGKSSDWVMTPINPPGFLTNLQNQMWNVNFTSVSGNSYGKNNSCGLFTQGVWGMYDLDGRNVNASRLVWAMNQVCADINPMNQSCSNDYQVWDHVSLSLDQYPWIQYNGGEERMSSVEITAENGLQFIGAANNFSDAPSTGHFEIPEFEIQGGTQGYGIREDGSQNIFENTAMTASSVVAGQMQVYFGGNGNICRNCSGQTTWNLNGDNNRVSLSQNMDNVTVLSNGYGNEFTGNKLVSPFNQVQPNRSIGLTSFISPYPYAAVTGDFLATGSFFNNSRDLVFFPFDLTNPGGCGDCNVITDGTSPVGMAWVWDSGATVAHFANDFNYTVGQNVAAIKQTVFVNAKCLSGSSFTFTVYANAVSMGSGSMACSTAYATRAIAVDLTSASGQAISFQVSGNTANVSYFGFAPYQNTLTISTAAPAAGSIICTRSAGPPPLLGSCTTALTGTPPTCTCN